MLWEILELWMNIQMKSNGEQQSMNGSFIKKAVPLARMGLDGLPM